MSDVGLKDSSIINDGNLKYEEKWVQIIYYELKNGHFGCYSANNHL